MCKQHYTVYSCSTPSRNGPVPHMKVHDTDPELCSLYLSTGSCPSRPSQPSLSALGPSLTPDSLLKDLTSSMESLNIEKTSSDHSNRPPSPPPPTMAEREILRVGNAENDRKGKLEDKVNYEKILHPVPQECRVCKRFRIWQKHKIMKRQREAEEALTRKNEEKWLLLESGGYRHHAFKQNRKCVIM